MAFPLTDAEHADIKSRIETQVEIVVAAAVRYDGAIIMFERPGRHGDALNWLAKHGVTRNDARDHGFVTNRGRFVDRAEAGRIVLDAAQGSPGGTPETNPNMHLFSEDMWNDRAREPTSIKPEEVF